jgi:septal ring factor EnvC (AmiA/AmiB activator)
MKKYIIIGIVLLWSLLLLVSLPAICSAEELPETITMSREQFNELQTIINRQENLLIGLSNTLELQQMNSNELKKLIEEQRLSYQKIRSELMLAQESLSNSKKTIAEQNKSLQTLSVQMKQEKSRSELKQRQKAFWGFAGGVLVGAIAASR